MRARGFGSGKRSSFNVYRFTAADTVCMVIFAVLLAVVIFAVASGAATAEYTPALNVAPVKGRNIIGLLAYCVFVFTPAVLRIREDIKWHSLRSGI